MQSLDHVMVVVSDLDEASARYASEYGLVALPGGRHEGLGTANAIIPFGTDYVELIAIADAEEAARNPVGQFLARHLSTSGEGLVACCLRTSDPQATAARTQSSPVPMARRLPGGRQLQWELLGMEGTLLHGLPFFITWSLDDDHPARMRVEHPSEASGVAWVELGGDAERVRAWIGADEPQIRLVGGEPGARRYAVTTPTTELVLS